MRMDDRQARGDARRSLAADMLKGAVAGAIGVWVMDRVDWFMYDHEDPEARRRTERVRPNHQDPAHNIAGMAARLVGREPPPQPHPAGVAVHYAVGILPAAAYAAVRHRLPGSTVSRGLLYGLGVSLVEDELVNPAIGASAPPRLYPWQAHARGLVAHLVYGVITEAVLSALDGRARPGGMVRGGIGDAGHRPETDRRRGAARPV